MSARRRRFLLGLKSDQIRWEVLHFSKTSLNSFRFWHVIVTPLSVWAYFFLQLSHLSTSGPVFSQKCCENVTPLSVWAYTFPKISFSLTPLRVRARARILGILESFLKSFLKSFLEPIAIHCSKMKRAATSQKASFGPSSGPFVCPSSEPQNLLQEAPI